MLSRFIIGFSFNEALPKREAFKYLFGNALKDYFVPIHLKYSLFGLNGSEIDKVFGISGLPENALVESESFFGNLTSITGESISGKIIESVESPYRTINFGSRLDF